MDLWTEYEGRTIDGAFPLTRLLRPEGRSAFFSTPNGTGSPTVIRLIESHFDGGDILVRWRGVAALNHPNLVKLKHFGQVVLDETPLVYAVMEPVDGNLAEILQERRLTEEETREVATSLLAAIEALHANGFVHEHVEAANVMAVGDAIKLRSDCIREAPEGEEGVALKRKDVHDYAQVLVEALTQKKTLEGPLPAPFYEIVRKGMNGDWGVAQIGAALNAQPIVQAHTPVAPRAEAPVSKPIDPPVVAQAPSIRRTQIPNEVETAGRGRWMGYGLGALLLLALVWYFASGRKASSNNAQNDAATQTAAVPDSAATATQGVVPSAAAPVAAVPSAAVNPTPAEQPVTADGRGGWRVIAFTYNHEDQAQHKVETIAKDHPELSPVVFTPSGHAPFLVALGGPMSKQDAFAFSGKAKRAGLPHDTYAQNYKIRN